MVDTDAAGALFFIALNLALIIWVLIKRDPPYLLIIFLMLLGAEITFAITALASLS